MNEGERLRRVFERLQTVTRRRHRKRLRRRTEGVAGSVVAWGAVDRAIHGFPFAGNSTIFLV